MRPYHHPSHFVTFYTYYTFYTLFPHQFLNYVTTVSAKSGFYKRIQNPSNKQRLAFRMADKIDINYRYQNNPLYPPLDLHIPAFPPCTNISYETRVQFPCHSTIPQLLTRAARVWSGLEWSHLCILCQNKWHCDYAALMLWCLFRRVRKYLVWYSPRCKDLVNVFKIIFEPADEARTEPALCIRQPLRVFP